MIRFAEPEVSDLESKDQKSWLQDFVILRQKNAPAADKPAIPCPTHQPTGLRSGSVVMHPQEDGFTVELIGEIANMVALALGPDTQKAASGEAAVPASFLRSVKVVAGAGFVQERTKFDLVRAV